MLLLPASSVNYRLKSLEAGGLVEMAEDPEDKRKMLIRLTSKGRDLLDRIDAEETQKERLRRSKYVRPAMRLERCFAILGTAD
jgi:DNA-binding MarR family transcriptional regulator